MKKLLLSAALASAIFAGQTACEKVLDKLDAQIVKTTNQKTKNPLKLEFLQTQKDEISKNCVDGKIDTTTLKQIKADTKYAYESKKLEQDKQKAEEKSKKLKEKQAKIEQKYQAQKDKIDLQNQKKAQKQAKKDAKQKEKQAKKQAKQQAKAAKKASKEQ